MRPAVGRLTRSLLLTLALLALGTGCGGYVPVRWPRRELWAPSADPRPPIALPSGDIAAYPGRIEREQVTVAVEVIGRQQTQRRFHADLLGRRIQPLMVVIANRSGRSYRFSKARVDPPVMAAARAARAAFVHPAVTIARHVKWLAFLLPGLVVGSVVEPATTFDFPGIEEAARRPPATDRRQILDDFLRKELADAEIPPRGSHAGVLFIRPPKLGGTIRLTLLEAATGQPLGFEVPVPPPSYAQRRTYPQAVPPVWEVALATATGMRTWRLRAADEPRGVITLEKGVRFLGWDTLAPVTITLQPLTAQQTEVRVETTLSGSDTASYGVAMPTIQKFYAALDTTFPMEAPGIDRPDEAEEASR